MALTTGTFGNATSVNQSWGPGAGTGNFAGFQFVMPAGGVAITATKWSFGSPCVTETGDFAMVYTDNVGHPGVQVGSNSDANGIAANTDVSWNFSTPVPVTPGNTYWIILTPGNGSGDRATNECTTASGYGSGRNNTITSIGTADLVGTWRVEVTYVQLVNFNGTGNLSSSSQIFSFTNPAAFAGAGSLSASTNALLAALTSFAGAGGLSISTIARLAGPTTFNGAGGLSGLGILKLAALPTFPGVGSLSSNSQVYSLSNSALFAGASSLSVGTNALLAAPTTLNGAGSISATGNTLYVASVEFAGTGNLGALVGTLLVSTAAFAGASDLSALDVAMSAGLADFAGSSNILILAISGKFAQAAFRGSSTFTISTNALLAAPTMFSGAGSMFVGTIQADAGLALLTGAGRFCIYAIVRLGPKGIKQNVVVPGPGVADNVVIV